MATPVLVGGTTIYVPTDLQKTQSDINKTAAFTDFVKKTIKNLNPAKTYYVQFKWVFEDGSRSRDWSPSYRLQIPSSPPLTPTGFTATRILGGITVSWTGAYSDGTDFEGFKSIKIYAGTQATATPGTYTFVGNLIVNKANNTLTIPVDSTTQDPNGVYVRYGNPIYIHAESTNVDGTDPKFVANVASVLSGAGKATDADINDGAVVITKLASNVLTVDNLKAGTINSTSYIRAGSKTVSTGAGARIEIASNLIEDGVKDILPGIAVYDTGGNAIFYADLSGNVTIGGYATTNQISGFITAGQVNANVTSISGGVISTGTIKSQGYTFTTGNNTTADGSGFSQVGTAFNLSNGTITAKNFRIDVDGNVEFKGLITTSGMALGKKADGTNDGIYLGANDYWYADKTFSFAGGSLTGNSSSITFNTGNITFSNTGAFQSDENNYAGDPTITLSDQNKLTLGRRLIYNVTSVPQNPVDGAPGGSAANTWNSPTQTGTFNWKNSGTAKPVKAGDLLFTT